MIKFDDLVIFLIMLQVCSLYEDYLEQLMLYPVKIVKRHVVTFCRDQIKKRFSSSTQQPRLKDSSRGNSNDDVNVDSGTADKSTTSNGENSSVPEPVQKIKEDIKQSIQDLPDLLDLTEINYHITLFLLWVVATSIHVPSVLVWARNYR